MNQSTLLVTVDCLRADHVHSYGYERETTPTVDQIAESGIVYRNAFSNGPGTRFAFKAINAGVYPLRMDGVGLPRREGTTIAEALSDAGYQTAGFANNPFVTSHFNHDRGFDTFVEVSDFENENSDEGLNKLNSFAADVHERLSGGLVHKGLKEGYERFLTFLESRGQSVGTNDSILIDRAVEWIQDQRESSQPYFVWVHLMDVHGPHQLWENARNSLNIETTHVRDLSEVVEFGEDPPRAAVDTYDASIRHADSQISRLLRTTDSSDNIIITADHGEEFGQHGDFHAPSTYQSMAHVPLIAAGPYFGSGDREAAVSHVDIAATILDIAGVEITEGRWDGVPLTESAEDKSPVFLGFESNHGLNGAVISHPWKYILKSSSLAEEATSEELYNIATDPAETEDLQGQYKDQFRRLQQDWERHMSEILSNRIASEHDIWDPSNDLRDEIRDSGDSEREIEEQLEYLGYK